MRDAMRGLLAHAWPILVAQLASIGMMLVDTAVLGHVSPEDLAAVAIGGGIHVSLVFALVGIVQAVAPMVAHLHGAGDDSEVSATLRDGLWLAVLLALPGMLFLWFPGLALDGAGIDPTVDGKIRAYLAILAFGLPASLLYRTFYAFCNALGRGRVLMGIGVASLGVHAILAWGLAGRGWTGAPLGVVGCALSNVVIAWLACAIAAAYLGRGDLARRYRLFATPWRPARRRLFALLRLGVPMGLSNFVEITAFTLISLFIAPLGATVVAGHRIVANLSALSYMVPLSLGIATLSAVGQAVGAHDAARVRCTVRAALCLGGALALLIGGLLLAAAEPLVAAYTDDPAVRGVAVGLVAYIACYQFFDALQTIAGHVLRAYRVTFWPMLVQTACFWGAGLLGGAWLCYRWTPPLGVAGFWLAAVFSLVLAASLLLPLMVFTMRVKTS